MKASELYEKLKGEIGKELFGKEESIRYVVTALLAGGHVLLEDVPGTGKTSLIRALAAALGAESRRVQFTPDLLPSDITGIHFYNQQEGTFTLRRGPVFTNLLLADEINRATPRTQAALLECMEERQVTLDGETLPLPEVFFVMATMNPIEFLILDEHTAALDPKTAEIIMELTDKIVKEKKVTTIMVTHNLRYAVEYGDRLIMMHQGNAIIDKAGEEKAKMKVDDILETFNRISIECGN